MPKLILTPVGTSLFTNIGSEDDRRHIVKYANTYEKDVPNALKQTIESYGNEINSLFERNDKNQLKKASAELNSLLTFYDKGFQDNKRDVHVLISTDTFLGKATSELIENYLATYFTVIVISPKQLSTRTKSDFQTGIRDLLKWCDKNLPEYKENCYQIIFNLTGGFKSLQGYLNTIGMFYADRIIYIFEGGKELISIPRLPIEIKTDVFRKHASLFLQLSQTEVGVGRELLKDIPEVMLEEHDERYILSDWGELSWNNAKEKILSESLIELPRIAYSTSFKSDFKNTQRPRDKVVLQETIAFISCRLQKSDGDISILKAGRSGGILYDNYTGRNSHLGHFRIGRGLRVSCEYKNEILELRHYGEHDYVNDNP